MKILYFDCSMGAAGDMLTASLLDLFEDKKSIVDELNSIGLEGVDFEGKEEVKAGIHGMAMEVKVHGQVETVEDVSLKDEDKHNHDHDHDHHHHHHHHHSHDHDHGHDHHSHDDDHHHGHSHHHVHRGMKEIGHIVENLKLSQKVKYDILEVYELIGQAESLAHNVDIKEIHFHEVGNLDAIGDIAAVCYLLDKISPDKIISSPINLGSGHVRCAHGILPVPAPATSHILRGVPVYSGKIESELCTPTGAALLKHFVDEFKAMPQVKVEKIGYGMGKKDFEVLNAVRAFLATDDSSNDLVYELSCNVDDMTGEDISYAMDKLFEEGAREVYVIPIIMKKSRPGNLIRVMCTEKNKDQLVKLIFKYTTTIGIREVATKRYVLDRQIDKVDSPFGPVQIKRSQGYGVNREKLEYDDLKKIADENDLSLAELRKIIKDGKN